VASGYVHDVFMVSYGFVVGDGAVVPFAWASGHVALPMLVVLIAVRYFVIDVPVLGEATDVFEEYAAGLSKEVEEQESARMLAKELSKKADDGEGEGGKKRAAVSKGTASKGTAGDLGRGRSPASVRAVVQCCAREAETLGARGALAACQVRDLDAGGVPMFLCFSPLLR
jgi:hypothetical protein